MDKESYRFIIRCLGISVLLLVISGITFGLIGLKPAELVPILAPVGTLLGGLLVVPPK
jgi:hypothetical protein